MKLTKAQRLFVAIGHVDKEITRYAEWEKRASSSRGKIRPSYCRERLMQTRALRKRLIREALRAYELEIGDAFSAGHALMRAISEDAPMVIADEEQTIIF